MICSKCGGRGVVFTPRRNWHSSVKMEYARRPCPGSSGGICPHAIMEDRRIGESGFAANPNVVVDDKYIHATLTDGRRVSVPLSIDRHLATASPEQHNRVEVDAHLLHWPDIDVDIAVDSFNGDPSRVFPKSILGRLVDSAAAVLGLGVPLDAKSECGRILRRVCDCDCHRFVSAVPATVPSGDGRECTGTSTEHCVKCGQHRGAYDE